MEDRNEPQTSRPRRGWGYTLLKCFFATMGCSFLGALGVFFLLRALEAPWFIPEPIFDWLHSVVKFWAIAAGAVLGSLLGLPASIVIVIYDAMKGRLTKLR